MTAMPSVFTVAKGKKKYFEMAFALARSFVLYNDVNKISFYIFSDRAVKIPSDVRFVKIRPLPEYALGTGLDFKLYFDQFAPGDKSLFIDADCMIFRDLSPLFDELSDLPISVIGFEATSGEWCGAHVEDVCRKLNLASIPRFNGGFYFICRGQICSAIYEKARSLKADYDRLGFARLGSGLNEEPLMSLAMAAFDIRPFPDDGGILSDLSCDTSQSRIDILKGATLRNRGSADPGRKHWMPFESWNPAVIHYGSNGHNSFFYLRENIKMKMCLRGGKLGIIIARQFDVIARYLYGIRAGKNGSKI
jgi:hypothetical protein